MFGDAGLALAVADPISPKALAGALREPELAQWTGRFLSVMALVDAVIDPGRIAAAQVYADALGLDDRAFGLLADLAAGQRTQALGAMTRLNMKSITNALGLVAT